MSKLAEVIRGLRLAIPAISLVVKDNDKERHITLGTGVNVHPYGFVITARHVVEQHIADLLGTPLEEVIPMLSEGRPLSTSAGHVQAELHTVFYTPTPGKMLRAVVPVTEFLLSFNDDICALNFAIFRSGDNPVQFHCAQLGGSLELSQGDEIATLGYPYGEELSGGQKAARLSASAGIVSAVVGFESGQRQFYEQIQMDMLLNPGNSGGPVFLRESGIVVGIVSSTFMQVNALEVLKDGELMGRRHFKTPTGLSFAVPEHRFRELMEQLAKAKKGDSSQGELWTETVTSKLETGEWKLQQEEHEVKSS